MTLRETEHASEAGSAQSEERITLEAQLNDVGTELDDSSIAALISFFTLLDRWDREAGNAEAV